MRHGFGGCDGLDGFGGFDGFSGFDRFDGSLNGYSVSLTLLLKVFLASSRLSSELYLAEW